jgi:hypothetical protein
MKEMARDGAAIHAYHARGSANQTIGRGHQLRHGEVRLTDDDKQRPSRASDKSRAVWKIQAQRFIADGVCPKAVFGLRGQRDATPPPET